MSKNLAKFSFILLTSVVLHGSMMLSKEEMGVLDALAPIDDPSLEAELDVSKAAQVKPVVEEVLYLSAILYFSKDRWTVWINDKTFTPEDHGNHSFKITKVNTSGIELCLNNADQKMVKLRSNQSLMAPGGQILEGDVRPKAKPIVL